MIGDHSALDLILQASLIVQFVMALLAGASGVSWAIIFRKRQLLKTERVASDQFEEQFWSGGDLSGLYKSLEAGSPTGMAGVFVAGFREFSRLRRQAGIGAAELLEGSRRAMRVAQLRETDRLEENLSTLATIGSTAPFVGLFGTVWGIYHALMTISGSQQVALDQIAGPVGEALIMTALGLFVAIPAVLAYNAFNSQLRLVSADLDGFAHDLHLYFVGRLHQNSTQG
jgi:biopolymer transport protein TolQ